MRLKEINSFYQPTEFLTDSKQDGVVLHQVKGKNKPPENPGFIVYEKFNGETLHSVGIQQPTAQPQLLIETKKFGHITSYLSPDFQKDSPELDISIEMPLPESVIDLCRQMRSIGGYALVVGGNVRDAMISAFQNTERILSKDIDLEVYGLTYSDLLNFLTLHFKGVKIDTVGRKFGIIKVYLPDLDEPIDINIPRTDSKIEEGHKGFIVNGDPGMNISDAGSRRDLRINSISYDPLAKTVFDPFGVKYDFENRLIAVTDPEKFIEDPLRVLRIMQFIARFEMNPTPETITLCKQLVNSGELDSLSIERVTEEMKKLLLKGKRASLGLNFALEVGIVERYWPEQFALVDKPQNPAWHPEGDVWSHTLQTVDAAIAIADRENLDNEQKIILVLTLLCHDLGKATNTIFENGAWRSPGHEVASVEPTKTFLSNFMLADDVVAQILALVPEHMQPKQIWMNQFPENGEEPIDTRRSQKRLANRLSQGRATMYLLALVAEADQRGRNGESDLFLDRDQVGQLDEWQNWFLALAEELNILESAPKALIQGADLMTELQLKHGGKGIGIILKMVYLDQLDGLIDTTDQAIAQARKYFQSWVAMFGIDLNGKKIMHHDSWNQLSRYEDPRALLLEKTN